AALIFCRYTPRAGPCPLSLHDALPILGWWVRRRASQRVRPAMAVGIAVVVVPSFIASLLWTNSNAAAAFFVTPTRLWELGLGARSEEHTSELQSRFDLVCRLLLEKKYI